MNLKLTTPSPADSAGAALRRIGRFNILRELGRGSVGAVYLAHDPVIDRQIAIKTFSPRLTPAEKIRHEPEFINEARSAGRLSHPNIITVFDAVSEGGTTYIAMEYLKGQELSKVLEEGERFNADEIASMIWKIADALEYAHLNGVVHRDVKPANIFLIGENQPKLVDFGIARSPNRLPPQGDTSNDSYTLFRNNLLGTPNYMSPEQAMGRSVDLRTDIYSLGVVMYELLAGCKPFAAEDATDLLRQVAHKNPSPPHFHNPRTPEMLSRIVMKAMSKRPEKRYQHADEMALDIKRYLVKEKRSRQRLKREMAILDQRKPLPPPLKLIHRKLFWLGVLASGLAAASLLLARLL